MMSLQELFSSQDKRYPPSRFVAWWVLATAMALSLAVYMLTIAPGLTWAHNGADGGDLIAASFSGGAAHPPGYPLYLMIGRLLACLPVGNVPYRYNLFSALAASGAAGLTAQTVYRLSEKPGWRAAAVGLSSGLGLAFTPLLWGQAIITEVYSFNALLGCLVIALSAQVPQRPAHLCALATAFSLAVLHHPTLACLGPLVAGRLAQAGQRLGWKNVLKPSLGGLLLGMTPLAYLPLAAHRPVVWGDLSNLGGIGWLISGQLYTGYVFGLPAANMIDRIAVTARTLTESFTLPGVAIGLIGIQAQSHDNTTLVWGTLLAGLMSAIFAIGYLPADSQIHLIPLLVVFAVWIGVGWLRLLEHVQHPAIITVILLPPIAVLAYTWQDISLRTEHAASDFVQGVNAQAPQQAIIITAEDRHTFALWVSAFVERQRMDIIIVDQDLLRFSWYRAALRRNFPNWDIPESNDVQHLIKQNAGHPVCRPIAQPPPWLSCVW